MWSNRLDQQPREASDEAPIVSRYGCAADRLFAPTAMHANGLTTPYAVNLVHYDNRAAFDAFTNDPDFQQTLQSAC